MDPASRQKERMMAIYGVHASSGGISWKHNTCMYIFYQGGLITRAMYFIIIPNIFYIDNHMYTIDGYRIVPEV
jgi:hypothetical protein